MIADIDEVLRQLLKQEIDIKGNEIDIKFDQPKREWSSRVGKPTINLFLFDIRENLRLRGAEQYTTIKRPDGTAEVRRNLARIDLRYLMTAWVKDSEDEHLLLSSALIALLRNPFIPPKLLPESLQGQPAPIPVEVATFPSEKGPVDKFTEIWGVLDNEIRPGILVTVTVAVDPYRPAIYKQVTTREMRFVQQNNILDDSHSEETKSLSKSYWSIGGEVSSKKYDPTTLKILIVEKNETVALNEDGKFTLPSLTEGEYHLDILHNEKVLKRQKIDVPADNYEIQV
ncbi:DUF4255 domain-containing protein [bacterium]|nr:DUF4255 domain-containing protein [bacterium]